MDTFTTNGKVHRSFNVLSCCIFLICSNNFESLVLIIKLLNVTTTLPHAEYVKVVTRDLRWFILIAFPLSLTFVSRDGWQIKKPWAQIHVQCSRTKGDNAAK